ncbi:MAG: hypothetical protein ACLQUY_10955 [Ktedonobacterales bacterium]
MAMRKGSQVKRELVQEKAASRRCSNSVRPHEETSRPIQRPNTSQESTTRKRAPRATPTVTAAKAAQPTREVATTVAVIPPPAPLRLSVTLPASILEPPVRTQLSVRQRLGELRATMAEGFLIQEPIYARPLWSSPDNSRLAYSFILQHDQVIRLITVPDGRSVQQFIRKHDLQIDYRR